MTKTSRRRSRRRSSTKSELDRNLDNLPPEIFEMIKEFALSCDVGADPCGITEGSVVVDRTYKPPSVLQLNRQIREREHPKYYSTNTFVVHNVWEASKSTSHLTGKEQVGKEVILNSWLASLAEDTAITIPRIRVITQHVNKERSDIFTRTGIYTQEPSDFENLSLYEANCGRIIWEWKRSFAGWGLGRPCRWKVGSVPRQNEQFY